ncbi:hypothetical protein [Candidatus Nitrospira salsa]
MRNYIVILSLMMGLNVVPVLHATQDNGAADTKKVVRGTLSAEGVPYDVEIKLFEYPPGFGKMHSHWNSLGMGQDGNLYVGVGDHRLDSHLYRYDPRTEVITDLGSVKEALKGKPHSQDQGKIHVPPYQAKDGAVFFATHFGYTYDSTGHMFKYTEEKGIEDLGAMIEQETYYMMIGDDKREKLYLTTVDKSHFVIRDLKTGKWEDKGVFTHKPPFRGVLDEAGNVYMYSYNGKKIGFKNRMSITRYDVEKGTLDTIGVEKNSLWAGVVTLDKKVAYVQSYMTGHMYSFKFANWPNLKPVDLGLIDPEGRWVYAHNFTATLDNKLLVLAGKQGSHKKKAGAMHGIWGYEPETRKKYMIADITEILSNSMEKDMSRHEVYWSNNDTKDKDGWIYIGVHSGGDVDQNPKTEIRLMAIRVRAK